MIPARIILLIGLSIIAGIIFLQKQKPDSYGNSLGKFNKESKESILSTEEEKSVQPQKADDKNETEVNKKEKVQLINLVR